jgi:hypothetical protein
MRIKASYTIENSVIIPVFTLIIVSLMGLLFYLHDTVIIKNATFQTAMRLEQQVGEVSETERSKMQENTKDYIKEKTIFATDISVVLKEENKESYCVGKATFTTIGLLLDANRIEKCVSVKDNNPPDFIRLVNATEKLR